MPDFLGSIKDQVDKAKSALGFGDETETGVDRGWPLDKKVEQADNSDPVGIYMKGSSLSHVCFGLGETDIVGNTPYLGHQYFVRINFDGELTRSYIPQFLKDSKRPSVEYSPIIKSIDLPSMSIETEKMNEYNRWRISQTKINYEPVKMTLHDSVNGLGLAFWRMYYRYYFRDGSEISTESGKKGNLPILPDAFTDNLEFGYNLSQVADIRYLIKSIIIYQVHAGRANPIQITNPRISDFSHGSMAYENSDMIDLEFTFDYEFATYLDSFAVSSDEDLVAHFDKSDVPEGRRDYPGNPYPPLPVKPPLAKVTEPEEQSLLDDIKNIKNPKDALEALKRAKSESKELLAQGAQAGALFNQVQMDVLGVDQPIVPAPSVRPFSAVVNTVPTGYADIRRSARKVRGGGG